MEGDISIHTEWIEYHIKKCDVVLPLVAIATPDRIYPQPAGACSSWTSKRTSSWCATCVKYNKRVIFPVDF